MTISRKISEGYNLWLLLLLIGLSACTITPPQTGESVNAPPTPTLLPDGWVDANPVMTGICFESAFDARDTLFVLRDDAELIRFFDLADNSGLCRRDVQRQGFDFSTGRIIAGLWSYGFGCTARHDVTAFNRDPAAQTLTIDLDFVTEGECPYELLRPFWVGVDGVTDYDIVINVTPAG